MNGIAAATLHATIPDGPKLPLEPPFEPNKMPSDVYGRVQESFRLIRRIAASAGMETLSFEVSTAHTVTPNDVADLAALVVEELNHLHLKFPGARPCMTCWLRVNASSWIICRAGFDWEQVVRGARPNSVAIAASKWFPFVAMCRRGWPR